MGGGDGIILKSISDFDFDGSASLTGGTTGSAGGGREERDEDTAGVVVVVELVTERGVEEDSWLDDEGAGLVGGATLPAIEEACDCPPTDGGGSWLVSFVCGWSNIFMRAASHFIRVARGTRLCSLLSRLKRLFSLTYWSFLLLSWL